MWWLVKFCLSGIFSAPYAAHSHHAKHTGASSGPHRDVGDEMTWDWKRGFHVYGGRLMAWVRWLFAFLSATQSSFWMSRYCVCYRCCFHFLRVSGIALHFRFIVTTFVTLWWYYLFVLLCCWHCFCITLDFYCFYYALLPNFVLCC